MSYSAPNPNKGLQTSDLSSKSRKSLDTSHTLPNSNKDLQTSDLTSESQEYLDASHYHPNSSKEQQPYDFSIQSSTDLSGPRSLSSSSNKLLIRNSVDAESFPLLPDPVNSTVLNLENIRQPGKFEFIDNSKISNFTESYGVEIQGSMRPETEHHEITQRETTIHGKDNAQAMGFSSDTEECTKYPKTLHHPHNSEEISLLPFQYPRIPNNQIKYS